MKKIIALFLTLSTVILAAASCADTSSNSNTTPAGAASTTSNSEAETKRTYATQATTYRYIDPSVTAATPDSLVFDIDFSESSFKDGKYKDITGNGHDAIVHGSIANENGSVKFDGTGESYIYIPDHPDFDFTAKQSFTLTVRFKAEPESKWACIVQKGLTDKIPAYYGFWLGNDNMLNMGVGKGKISNMASNNAIDTEWHEAVMIQDAKAGTILFYLDGVLQNTTYPKTGNIPVKPTSLAAPNEDLTIGTNLSEHFKGLIDSVRLYNYAVPEKELFGDMENNPHTLERKYYEYTDSETKEKFTLPYRAYYPSGYDAADGKKYPVLLYLHGHGECGKNNVAHLRNSSGHISNIMSRDNCIIILPQCDCDQGVNKEWVASNHQFDKTNRTLPEKATLALRAVISLMDEISQNPKTDTDRIFAFGFSMGGFGVWEILMRKPDMFAAAVIFSAAGAPASADKVLDIDIRAYHGKADDVVPVSGLELMDAAMTALGATKFQATYFDNIGHNDCMVEAFSTQGNVFDWLLAQTKAD
jgi:predicted esterase